MRKNENKLGEINYNTYGSKMTIIRYLNNRDVDVKFEDGYIARNREYRRFKEGTIKSPYDKSVYHIGYMGEGKYTSTIDKIKTNQYVIWHEMISRCYDKKVQEKHPTYKGCSVCEEWHNFQNFAKWYDENYYDINGERMCLDKDILIKGNKIYSSETCVFVPKGINVLFTKNDKIRGSFPIGVHWCEASNDFIAQCCNGSKRQIYLGHFNTPTEAFYAYKKTKEQIIKNIAGDYKDKIPKKLYKAMNKYEVEIND